MNTQSLDSLRQRPHWSFSQINGLVNHCSLKWAFRYAYDEEPEFTPSALVFGSVFHQALSFACGRRASAKEVTAEECGDVFADLFTDNVKESEPVVKFNDGEAADAMIAQGRQMIGAWFGGTDPDEEILSIGVLFSVPLTDRHRQVLERPLIGEFDLVVRKDHALTIVDWKTSARRWPEGQADSDLQPVCYSYAHWKSTGELPAFRFDVVTKTKTPALVRYETRRTLEDALRLVETVRVLERMIKAECFFPQDGSRECGSCPYGAACRAWHQRRSVRHFTLKAA